MAPSQPSASSLPWLRWGLGAVFLFAFGLRFWRLTQFNTLVFDEVYYPVFANRYLLGDYVYNSHPPLSQYIIAIGIWLGSHLSVGQEMVNGLTGSLRSTFSYRWFNGIAGSCIPVVVGLIAYELSRNRVYAAIAALVTVLDGLFLVESRYALNNVYLVLFGLLGHWFVLKGLSDRPPPTTRRVKLRRLYPNRPSGWLRHISDEVSDRWRFPRVWQRGQFLSLAGVCFGCTIAVKWNGLGFLLSIYGFWLILKVLPLPESSRLQRLTHLKIPEFLGYFALLPLLVYCLLWLPHLSLNPELNFWQLHRSMLAFHEAIGSDAAVHPYCSAWYGWPLMERPIAYFYETAPDLRNLVPIAPPLPGGWGQITYTVYAMGNPLLWWSSTAAIAFTLLSYAVLRTAPAAQIWLYCLGGYLANWLPWSAVSRCTFLYHYMAALIFAQLALAYWLAEGCIRSHPTRILALSILGICSLGFIFWLPIYLGLPLTAEEYQARMWFEQWI